MVVCNVREVGEPRLNRAGLDHGFGNSRGVFMPAGVAAEQRHTLMDRTVHAGRDRPLRVDEANARTTQRGFR